MWDEVEFAKGNQASAPSDDEFQRMNNSSTGNRSVRNATGRKAWPWALFGFWACLVTVPLSYLMAGHFVSLPVADQAISLEESKGGGEWSLLHVLDESCGCSRNVLDYLIERGEGAGSEEAVVLVDGASTTRGALEARGFRVVFIDSDTLAEKYGSEGVPFFQVTDPDGELWYSGAYQDIRNRSSSRYLDLETLSLSQSGTRSNDLPVLGCATSERLKQAMDPLSLKYN